MATVLIVEDDATNMTLAEFLRQSAGHTGLSATDAEAGLTLARDEQPNLILTALAMKGDEERIPTMRRQESLATIPAHRVRP